MLLECFLILCHKRVIRDRLRLKKVYPILRNLDVFQDNEEVSVVIYDVVSQLIGNEDPSNPTQLNLETNNNINVVESQENESKKNEIDLSNISISNISDESNENHLDDVD